MATIKVDNFGKPGLASLQKPGPLTDHSTHTTRQLTVDDLPAVQAYMNERDKAQGR